MYLPVGRTQTQSSESIQVLCDSNLSLPVLYMTNNNMYLPVGRTQTQSSESIQVLCDSNLSLPVK